MRDMAPSIIAPGVTTFPGAAGWKNCFNHLRLDPEAYQQYLEAYQEEIEDFQGGARYVKLSLFSYLTTRQYIDIYQKAHFVVKELILEISQDALRFNKKYPDKIDFLVNKYKDRCCKDDLLIKTNYVIINKL